MPIRKYLIEKIFVLNEFGMNGIVITITPLVIETIVIIYIHFIVCLVMFKNINNKRRFH